MAGRYGADDVQVTEDKFQKSAKDVYVRSSKVDYTRTAQGIISTLGSIQNVQDHKAKQQALQESMGLAGVLSPRSENKYDRNLEHMNGRATVIQFKTDMDAESAKYNDLPDEQYDLKMGQFKRKYFKGKTPSFLNGLVAAGGLDAEDRTLAKRHQAQRGKLADTWSSGTKQRTDGLLAEGATVDGLMNHLAQEKTMGADYFSDPKVTEAKAYESISNWAKGCEGRDAKKAYELMKDLVNRPSVRPEDKGQRLKDTELNPAIMNDLEYLKKKASAGVSGQTYLDTKGMKTSTGAPDLKQIGAHLDSEVEAGNITLAQRNTVMNTHLSDYQTSVQMVKQQKAQVTENVVKQISSMILKKNYKGAMDELLNHPEADPITLVALQRTIESDVKRAAAGDKPANDAASESAVVHLLMDMKDNPLMDMNDAIATMESQGIPIDFDTLKLMNTSWNILQSPAKKSYCRVIEQINGRYDYSPDKGFTVPNQRGALATRLAFNERIQKMQDAGEQINWTELEEGVDKEGHWLFEEIKDNQPTLQDSIQELLGRVGVSKKRKSRWAKDKPDAWKDDLDRGFRTYTQVPISVDLLSEYIRGMRPGITDAGVKTALTDAKQRDFIITQYIKKHN